MSTAIFPRKGKGADWPSVAFSELGIVPEFETVVTVMAVQSWGTVEAAVVTTECNFRTCWILSLVEAVQHGGTRLHSTM